MQKIYRCLRVVECYFIVQMESVSRGHCSKGCCSNVHFSFLEQCIFGTVSLTIPVKRLSRLYQTQDYQDYTSQKTAKTIPDKKNCLVYLRQKTALLYPTLDCLDKTRLSKLYKTAHQQLVERLTKRRRKESCTLCCNIIQVWLSVRHTKPTRSRVIIYEFMIFLVTLY